MRADLRLWIITVGLSACLVVVGLRLDDAERDVERLQDRVAAVEEGQP